MGRSRGGLTTKTYALTDGQGQPLELVLTPGQAGDCPVSSQLLRRLHEDTIVRADKAYDANKLRRRIEASGSAPNIPSMVHRRHKACFSRVLHKSRNRIERFFNRIKHCLSVATRYEEHVSTGIFHVPTPQYRELYNRPQQTATKVATYVKFMRDP